MVGAVAITGNKAAPGLWMAFAGACGLIATVAIYGQKGVGTKVRQLA